MDDDTDRPAHPMKGAHRATASRAPPRKDHFLQLMFFRASPSEVTPHEPVPRTGDYAPMPTFRTRGGHRFNLPPPSAPAQATLASRAIDVMTDLRRVAPVTIAPGASVADANRTMIGRGVRALFVVAGTPEVLGIVTATDILGERPLSFAQSRNIHYDEITVRDIMTSEDRLEVLHLDDVMTARVGDVVATLRRSGRQHALVVDTAEGTAPVICGMFSLTQIGRRLGIPPQQVHDIARTFAEIEALIASR
jgi:CBS domain-containing protein